MVLAQAGVAGCLTVWYLECSLATLRRWSTVPEETAQLFDRPRSGRPPIFSEATCLRVIAFYCQNPLSGCRGWSLSWAAQHLSKKLEIIGRAISSSTIHRILRKHGLPNETIAFRRCAFIAERLHRRRTTVSRKTPKKFFLTSQPIVGEFL